MKISFNWLKNYVDINLDSREIANKLTLLGLEVEQTESFGADLEGFIVGEVLNVIEHPFADKLHLCKVSTGEKELQIVCGADNVARGQKVPVATVGSTIPKPMDDGSSLVVKKIKLRGEDSEGMICSEMELEIGQDHSGIMVLDPELQAGTDLSEALKLVKDTIFDIGLTPNRPDASCHIGVARDLAAVLQTDLNNPYKNTPGETEPLDEWIDIEIRDPKQCHRYVAKIVKNVTVEESPPWLKNQLRSIGLRPINNVVDVTNYVLHEIGQPLHAFDYEKLNDEKIVVQSYKETRSFTTLDDIERNVPAGTLFICDGKEPIAIAGVMGGLNSEVTRATQHVLIESAYFDPSSIRKTSKHLGLQTDSSYRFERGIDPNLARRAAERAAELIVEIAGGEVLNGCTDNHPVKSLPQKVGFRLKKLNNLLGTKIKIDQARKILDRLEIETRASGTDELQCTIPTFRPDLTREVDLIEEIGRIYDYNNIPSPESTPFYSPAPISDWEILKNRIRSIASRLKYKEISSNSLLSEREEGYFSSEDEQIRTLNPVSQEATTLRTSLLGGFLKILQFNLNRNAKQLRFFEIGNVYRKSDKGTWIDGIEEHTKLLLGICGFRSTENWLDKAQYFTVFDLKSDLESLLDQTSILDQLEIEFHSREELRYIQNDQVLARLIKIPDHLNEVFDIKLPAFAAEIDLTLLNKAGFGKIEKTYKEVPRFPTFEYDAAYIVDEKVTAGRLSEIIHQTAGEILHNLEVFDVFEGENLGKNKKSIAFRLTFLDPNKTLTINDVEPIVQKVTKALEQMVGAILRS